MQEKDLQFIYGNPNVKRAIIVAAKAQQTLLIIGAPDTQGAEITEKIGKKLDKDGDYTQTIFFWQPCPCGYFGHPEKECICTSAQIAKHLAKKPKADLITFINHPHFDDLKINLKDKQGLAMLEKYYKLGKINYQAVFTILKTAKTIAEMRQSVRIQPFDIAEAISYKIE